MKQYMRGESLHYSIVLFIIVSFLFLYGSRNGEIAALLP